MISRLELTVIDAATQAPLPGVTISLKSIVTKQITNTQITDAAGKTVFNVEEGVWRFIAFKGGYQGKEDGLWLTYPAAGYKISLIVQDTTIQPPTLPAPQPPILNPQPGEPLPLPDKHEIIGTYGSRCDLMNNSTFSKSFYAHRDRYTGATSSYTSDLPTAREQAEADKACYLPAPPTAADWQSGIQTQISEGFGALTKYITDSIKTVTDSAAAGLAALDASIKAWIADNILELLLKKLMER